MLKTKKKKLTLEQEIELILRHYWMDTYNKSAYIKNCIKKIMELIKQKENIDE